MPRRQRDRSQSGLRIVPVKLVRLDSEGKEFWLESGMTEQGRMDWGGPKPTCVLRPIVNADSCDLKYGQHFVKMNLE